MQYQEWLHYLLFFAQPVIWVTDHAFVARTHDTCDFGNRICAHTDVSAEEVEAIKRYFDGKRARWFVDDTDTKQKALLETLGFKDGGAQSAMKLDLRDCNANVTVPDGASIRKVTTDEERALWIELVAQNAHMDASEVTFIVQSIVKYAPQNAVQLYVGFYKQIPVATALIIEREDVATLHMVNTLEAYRKQGIGTFIIRTALCELKHTGIPTVILSASVMGKQVYEKIGFLEYAVYRKYTYIR